MVNYQLRRLMKYHEKLYVYLIGQYVMIRKVQKEKLNTKSVTMIDIVTGWFKITQYDDKRAI